MEHLIACYGSSFDEPACKNTVRYYCSCRLPPDSGKKASALTYEAYYREKDAKKHMMVHACNCTGTGNHMYFIRREHVGTLGEGLLHRIQTRRGRATIIYDSLLTFATALDRKVGDLDYFAITDMLLHFPSRVLLTALIYFKRYIKRGKITLGSVQLYLKMFFSCVVIGSKYIDDESICLEDICILLQIPKCSIILPMEMHLLNVLGFDLQIEDSEYAGVIDSIVLRCCT